MAHELEFVNGTASYAGRSPAWHQLGTVIDDLTYEQALQSAHLGDWNVRAVPFTPVIGDDHDENMPLRELITVATDHQIIVRDNPATGDIESLGIVGERYEPVQNEAAFAVAEYLQDLGAVVETAGSIRGGRQVFLSMSLDGGFVIDPDGAGDAVNGYLLLRTSHDGSLAVEAVNTWVRVVCANTFDVALSGRAKRGYKVRHTAQAQDRLAEAQSLLLNANGYGKALAAEASALHKVPVSNAEFVDLATIIYPKPESKRGITLWENKIDLLGDLYSGGGDVDYTLGNVTGTAWGALNAFTERLDWHRKSRKSKSTENGSLLGASGFVPTITAEKQQIFTTVSEWAREKSPAVFV